MTPHVFVDGTNVDASFNYLANAIYKRVGVRNRSDGVTSSDVSSVDLAKDIEDSRKKRKCKC